MSKKLDNSVKSIDNKNFIVEREKMVEISVKICERCGLFDSVCVCAHWCRVSEQERELGKPTKKNGRKFWKLCDKIVFSCVCVIALCGLSDPN